LIDTDDSIHLCKLLKLENISCANSYDLRLDSKVSHLRSGQIELGIIWVLDKVCLPILIGVIGRIIGDKIINRLKSKNDELEKINTQIEIKIVDDNLSIISIKHNGDAEKLMKILEGLKND